LKKVNFAKVRSATSTRSYKRALLALGGCVALWAGAAASPAPAAVKQPVPGSPPVVTLAVLPGDTTHDALGAVEGISPGALSPGLGGVPAAQSYLDISQGNRVFGSLYDFPLPPLVLIDGRIPPSLWDPVVERAEQVPADIVPGLLGSTIAAERGAGAPVAVADSRAGLAGLAAVDEGGAVASDSRCPPHGCAGLNVVAAQLDDLPAMIDDLGPRDMLISLERPPPEQGDLLSIGIAGDGFDGLLTSDSTRLPGLVLTTDLAPTILERLGIAVPAEMSGNPVRTEGEPDGADVTALENRLGEVRPRRGPVIGSTVLSWIALALGAMALFGARAARPALSMLALSAIYLPALLLGGAAVEPAEWVEALIVGIGAPLLAAATLALLRGYAAVATACAVTVFAYAVDVVAGSPLTSLSLMGPNPALGVRFFGIGNELEATLAPLVLLGAGAGIAAWMPSADVRRDGGPAAAVAFGAACLVATAAFAPGRFGADVGAAIVLAVGGGVAAAAVLKTARRRTLVLVLAAPVAALALLAAADLLLGGDAHLSRSVLEAGGLDEVGEVAERRLRLSAASFSKTFGSPFLVAAAVLIVFGIAFRRRIASWFADSRPALAGFLGAIAAIAVGTLANDSGVLLLMIGTGYVALFAGYVWALRGGA
jgi:hypothetical protein